MFLNFSLENISILTFFITFILGILVCFTPCVYPIIPVIISYIGAGELKTKKEAFYQSLSYTSGMAIVYSILGSVAALTGELFGRVQSNFWINFMAANIFIVMGLFMLDVFHMPQISFFQRLAPGNKTGIWGAFLAGVVSGFVVGPCITPVLGAILTYVAVKKKIVLGISLLFTYALGMGLPLVLLGSFIGILKKLPKSGPWMGNIKKIFGLLLIASGEYFLVGLR